MNFKNLFYVMLITFVVSTVSAKEISICSDDNFWYPFSYSENGTAKGWHIDIITTALKNLGYQYKIVPLSWKRCLEDGGKNGQFDAVANASYKPSRAEYLSYPPENPRQEKSDWRIMQVEYVVVSDISETYRYQGDPLTLPLPVRGTMGYSIVDDLKESGVKVDIGHNSEQNIKSLVRDKKGVVITVPQLAKFIAKKHHLENKIIIHSDPIKSKSYFFAFSQKSKVSEKEKLEIWQEIVRIRENEFLMNQFSSQY
ncbi:MAG: transporter substrate-binding domain-containing protein [Gammaproteobacteria bacterium]|nr:transporter substrate-binding domain-containing protein [Gammaproteobacteria bacterium]